MCSIIVINIFTIPLASVINIHPFNQLLAFVMKLVNWVTRSCAQWTTQCATMVYGPIVDTFMVRDDPKLLR